MTARHEPGLFDKLQPRCLEISNGDLIAVLRSLKERGAHVSGMVSKGDNSGWRLTIEWPAMISGISSTTLKQYTQVVV
jgi:hypothetical protein